MASGGDIAQEKELVIQIEDPNTFLIAQCMESQRRKLEASPQGKEEEEGQFLKENEWHGHLQESNGNSIEGQMIWREPSWPLLGMSG